VCGQKREEKEEERKTFCVLKQYYGVFSSDFASAFAVVATAVVWLFFGIFNLLSVYVFILFTFS